MFLTVSEANGTCNCFSRDHPPVHFITAHNVCFLQGFDCIEFSRLLMFCKQHLDRRVKEATVWKHSSMEQEGKKSRKTWSDTSGCDGEEEAPATSLDVPFQSDLDPAQKGTRSPPVAAPRFWWGQKRKPRQCRRTLMVNVEEPGCSI